MVRGQRAKDQRGQREIDHVAAENPDAGRIEQPVPDRQEPCGDQQEDRAGDPQNADSFSGIVVVSRHHARGIAGGSDSRACAARRISAFGAPKPV